MLLVEGEQRNLFVIVGLVVGDGKQGYYSRRRNEAECVEN